MEQPEEQDRLIGVKFGNYEVRTKLGVGGMGSVYMAEHPLIGKKVALKVLHAEFSSNRDVVTRFFNEARAVNDIQHPNIVDIVDYGVLSEHGHNTVYFIMEFLDGRSLSELMRREAPLAPERALAIALQIADALGASHRKGIVHRDLKPDNVMLVQHGREADFVKVLDFGIAKLTGDHQGATQTRTGVVMGTPAYMSPEQCEGSGNVDQRADVYALGILLYEMLTGQVPFTGEGYGEILVKHLTLAPAPPSTIRGVLPPHVEAVVLKALEKSPDARYASMDEFMLALADPVEYVERNGGIGAFVRPQASVMTAGGSLIAPGLLAVSLPAPGQLTHVLAPALSSVAGGAGGAGGAGVAGHTAPGAAGASRPGRLVVITGVAALALAVAAGGYALFGRGGSADVAGQASAGPTLVARQPAPAGHAPGDQGEREPGIREPGIEVDGDPARAAMAPDADTGAGADVGQDRAVETVTVQVLSEPEGAEVFVGEEVAPRGITPLALALPRGSEAVPLLLRRDGYEDITHRVEPTGDAAITLELRRARRGNRARPGRARPRNRATPQKQTDSPGKDTQTEPIDNDVLLEEPDWN